MPPCHSWIEPYCCLHGKLVIVHGLREYHPKANASTPDAERKPVYLNITMKRANGKVLGLSTNLTECPTCEPDVTQLSHPQLYSQWGCDMQGKYLIAS